MESSALASALESRNRVAIRSRILGDGDRERGEPAHRVGFKPERMLGRDHRGKRPAIGDAAEDRLQQAAVGHRVDRTGGAVGDHQLEHLHPHAFGRQARKSRAAADAGEISGAIGLARAEGGVNAEEPEDAQIILCDPLARHRR